MESSQKESPPPIEVQKKKYVWTSVWKYPFSFERLDELYWVICGLMNSKEGGTIAVGVNEKGQDVGITLTSSDKDELEREMSYSIDNVAPKIARISVLNFVSTSFRELSVRNYRLPPHVKYYVVEIKVNPGNPERYYTRMIAPMKKTKIWVRTAAQIRGFEIDVSNSKKNLDQPNIKFEPENQPESYSEKHMQLNKVKSEKKQNDEKKVKRSHPRNIPKNIQINDTVARVEKKNEYINQLIATLVKTKSLDLAQNLEDLEAVVKMLNSMEDIALQTKFDFDKKFYDRETKDVRYTH